MRDAVFAEIGMDGSDSHEYVSDVAGPVFGLALMALSPTIGLFLATIEYDDCERWWRLCLEMRARAQNPEMATEVAEGRA